MSSPKFAALQQTASAAKPTADLGDAAVAEQTVKLFNALVDFVRDPRGIPDGRLNSLGRLMWRSVGGLVTPTGLDRSGELPTMTFAVMGNHSSLQAMIMLPRHFSDMVREDLILQIGAVVNNASQVRDFVEGRFRVEGSEPITRRARVYEAQGLIAMKALLEEAGLTVQWDKYQSAVLDEFPEGLKSMPPALAYGQELST